MRDDVMPSFQVSSGAPNPLALNLSGQASPEGAMFDADLLQQLLGSLQARYNFNAQASPQGLQLSPNARLEGNIGPLRAEIAKQMGMPATAGVHYNEGNLHAFLQKQMGASRPVMGVDYSTQIGDNTNLSAYLSKQHGQRPDAGVNLNYTRKF